MTDPERRRERMRNMSLKQKETDPLKVSCPQCGAKPNYWCGPYRREAWQFPMHLKRIAAARKLDGAE
jgi:hypothetical protein